jgi:hypothetical protein
MNYMNLLKKEHRPRRIHREQQKFQVFLNSEQPKYHYFLSSKNEAKTTLRVFFKKKKKQLQNRVQMQDAAPQTNIRWEKCLKFEGTIPAQRKKNPSTFEFPPAEPPPFFKSPKRRRNYCAPFVFKKGATTAASLFGVSKEAVSDDDSVFIEL